MLHVTRRLDISNKEYQWSESDYHRYFFKIQSTDAGHKRMDAMLQLRATHFYEQTDFKRMSYQETTIKTMSCFNTEQYEFTRVPHSKEAVKDFNVGLVPA